MPSHAQPFLDHYCRLNLSPQHPHLGAFLLDCGGRQTRSCRRNGPASPGFMPLCSSTTRIFVPFISGSETLRPKPEVSRDAFVEGVEIRKHYATVTHTTIQPENCPVPICQIWQVTAGPCRAIKTWQELELNLRYLRVGLRRQLGRLAIRILIDVLLDL